MMVTCYVYFVTNLKILCASIAKFFIFGANGTSWIYILTALLFELVVFLNNSTMYQPIHGILLLTVICTFNSFVSYWESLLKKKTGGKLFSTAFVGWWMTFLYASLAPHFRLIMIYVSFFDNASYRWSHVQVI